MNIIINRINDKFVLRFDVVGLDNNIVTTTLEIGWQEADEIQRAINQHLLDWQIENDPSLFKDDEPLPF